MVSVQEVGCFYNVSEQINTLNDGISIACQSHFFRMQEKFTEIMSELVISEALLSEAIAKVVALEAEVAQLVALLPESAGALALAQEQLVLAIKNQTLMQNRVSLCVDLQAEFSSFMQDCKDKFNDLSTKYSNKLEELGQRLAQASKILEEYLSQNFCANQVAFVKQQTQKFEYEKLKYRQGKITSEELNKAYIEKLEALKENFIKSQRADKCGVKISKYNLPEFESKYEMQLSVELIDKERYVHFKHANQSLKNAIKNDEKLRAKFSNRQIEQIESGYTPEGYTWHHDGNPPLGRLQLVTSDKHSEVRHDGGYTLWTERNLE